MTLPVASSTFTAGPKDTLAAPDIYKLDPKKIISSIPVKASQLTDLFSSITTKNGQFDIKGALGKLDKYDFTSDLSDAAKQLGANARELGSDVMGKATTLLEKATPGAKALSCKIGDYASAVNWKDTRAALEVGVALSSMNGAKDAVKVANKAASTGLFSGLIEKASSAGMSGVFDSLKNTMQENGVLSRVVKASVPFVLSTSNVRLLDELARGGVGRTIDAVSPGFTKAFTSTYRASGGYLNNITTFTGVLGAFDSINKDWDKVSTGDGLIGSIVDLFSSSSAFRSVVYSGVMYGINYALTSEEQLSKNQRLERMALATLYKQSTVSEQIAKYFPNVVMIGKYDMRPAAQTTTDIKLLERAVRAFIG